MPVTVIKETADSILPMIAHGLAMPTRAHVDPQRHGDCGQKLTAARALRGCAAGYGDACSAAVPFQRRCGCTSHRCAGCAPSARDLPTLDCAAVRTSRYRSPAM